MPLHQWYIPRGLYTQEDKANLATAITDVYYTKIWEPIAKLLVEVQFSELNKEDRFVSGEPTDNQVQVRVFHVARHHTKGEKMIFTELYEKTIKPCTQDREVTWEVQIAEEDPFFWRINGMIPPYATGDKKGEELWYKTNKALPIIES